MKIGEALEALRRGERLTNFYIESDSVESFVWLDKLTGKIWIGYDISKTWGRSFCLKVQSVNSFPVEWVLSESWQIWSTEYKFNSADVRVNISGEKNAENFSL